MSGAARLGDICSGHGCFPPRHNSSGSENVFINALNAHRVGDSWLPHSCVSTHDSTLSTGCLNVFINGMQAGRIGDVIECGSTIASGSQNVFIGT